MAIYEERLQRDLTRIRQQVLQVGKHVQQSYKNSIHTLLTGESALANRVILEDEQINRAIRLIDDACHKFIAVHLPSAGHLRMIASIIRVNIELERMGDYAATICKESLQISQPPEGKLAQEIEHIADITNQMLGMALDAFEQNNADIARVTRKMAKPIGRSFAAILERLVDACREQPDSAEDLFRLMHVFAKLTRVADQVRNFCSEIMFAVTGEIKLPKKYRLVFLDDTGNLSRMAEAIGDKLFPNSAKYRSFAKTPAASYDPAMLRFLADRGIEVRETPPQAFDLTKEELQELGQRRVIISLQGPIATYLEHLPFHIVTLEWDIGACPAETDEDLCQKRYEELYQNIASQLSDLLDIVGRKEEA